MALAEVRPGAVPTALYRRPSEGHLIDQGTGSTFEGLVPGWIGAAVPIGASEQTFAELLASAPYPIREAPDEDTAADG